MDGKLEEIEHLEHLIVSTAKFKASFQVIQRNNKLTISGSTEMEHSMKM